MNMTIPRPSSAAGHVCLVAGLISPFVLPFGAHLVVCLIFCAAGIMLLAAGAAAHKFRPRRPRRRPRGRPV